MKWVFLILLLVCVTSYVVAIIDMYRRTKKDARSFRFYWLLIIFLLPIIGPAIYLLCRRNQYSS
jgi:cytochrome bd-type quinol oxidase subunit 2